MTTGGILAAQRDSQTLGGDRSLNVLIAAQPATGGVAVAVSQLAAAGVVAGHRVTVACPPKSAGPLVARLEEAGAHHVEMFGESRLPSARDGRDFISLRRIAKHHDVIHLHSSKAGAIGRLAALSLTRQRPPVVFTPHAWSWLVGGRLAGAFRVIERVLAGAADVIVAVSEDEATEGQAHLGRRAERLRVIYNGVDRDQFTPQGPTARRDPSVPLLVCVGRLCRQKGQDVAIRALSQMRNTDAVLRLVGDGESRDDLVQLARGLGVADRIEWAGAVSDTAPEFRSADIVVAPSRWDGLSLVLLEAMACGAAIVATNVSGSEVLEEVGVVVEPDDSAGLAEALDVLLDDVITRKHFGIRARERSRLFDLETNLGLNLGLWSELAGRVPQ